VSAAERAREIAGQVVHLTDQSLRAIGVVATDLREYRAQADRLRSNAENIPASLRYITDAISDAKESLANCTDNNLIADNALEAMPVKEVYSIRADIVSVNMAATEHMGAIISDAEENLQSISSSAEPVEEYAAIIDGSLPNIDRSEDSWIYLRFAYKTLKRVWDSI